MIDDKYLALMHQELDGEITSAEKTALDQYLAGNAEAAQYYKDLKAVISNLEEMPLEAAPSGLKDKIMDGLPVETYQKADNELKMPAASDIWRTGWVFAAGLAAGLFAWGVFGNLFPVDDRNRQLQGNLPGAQAEQGLSGSQLAIDLPQVRGFAQLEQRGEARILSLYLDGEGTVEVTAFNPDGATMRHFAQEQGADLQLSSQGGKVHFFHQGRNQYILSFDSESRMEKGVELTLHLDGKVAFRQTVPVN